MQRTGTRRQANNASALVEGAPAEERTQIGRRARFKPDDEALMAELGARLAATGLRLARGAAGPVDYYRIMASECDEAIWIVLRHLDGTYHLCSGLLEPLRTGKRLRDVLLPDWLAPGPSHRA